MYLYYILLPDYRKNRVDVSVSATDINYFEFHVCTKMISTKRYRMYPMHHTHTILL